MKIIIIGGIAAGASAAAKAKRLDPSLDITIYEKGEVLSFGACGLPYYIGGYFADENAMIARKAADFEKNGINVKTCHEVVSVHAEESYVTVKNLKDNTLIEVPYDKLLIAAGANVIVPSLKNIDLDNVYTLKSLADGRALREAVFDKSNMNFTIIGGGYIGLEAVDGLKENGKHVRLVEMGERILAKTFDQEITDIIEQELIDNGVELHLGERITSLEGSGAVRSVVTDKGEYESDVVLLATGVSPATSFLEGTGIKTLPNGAVITDGEGRTNIPNIFAAGDCASVYHLIREDNVYIPLATTANKLGRVIGENLAGQHKSFQGTLGAGCLKVLGLEAGRCGITEAEAKEMGISYGTTFIKDKDHTNYYPNQRDIFVKLIYDRETRVILGGQAVGSQGAVLRVDVLCAAVYKKMTVDELGYLDLCYSPPFARTWDVLNVAGNSAKK